MTSNDDLTLETDPLDVIEEEEEPKAPKQLRDALSKANAENERLKQDAMTRAFTDLGLDPTKGVGKAANMTYEGDPAGLKEYMVEEFDYLGPANPLAGEIAGAQARFDQASLGAGSVPVVSPIDQQLAEAEARRDNATTMALKGQQIEDWFGG